MSEWCFAGLASSFHDIRPTTVAADDRKLFQLKREPDLLADGKVLQISRAPGIDSTASVESLNPSEAFPVAGSDKLQVLVFRYRGRIHAIDNTCPHRSFPLCRGTLHDIEDFGILLSAAVSCPKHGWSFDLTTGESSGGRYKLPVWEVDLRDAKVASGSDGLSQDSSVKKGDDADEREVWVRRRA